MPAAAVIPAPIAYIKVVAVKKLVVEFLARGTVRRRKVRGLHTAILGAKAPAFTGRRPEPHPLL